MMIVKPDIVERTKSFALRIIRLYSALPKMTEAQVLGKQVLRSGTSVGAHVREGRRSRSDVEMISKVEGALFRIHNSSFQRGDGMTQKPLMPSDSAGVPSQLFGDIRRLIDETRTAVAATVNAGLTMLYWRIGNRIGQEILKDARAEYGAEIVVSLIRQLSWTHIIALIPLKQPLQREFYAEMCRVERWSVRTLRQKIASMLYERTALSRKPAELAKLELRALREEDRLTPDLVFSDPYLLEFLGLQGAYQEKDLEAAILRELEAFIMELYLRWLDRHERKPGEGSPLGIILCAGKNAEQIELLELGLSGIHVAEYLTVLPPKDVLKRKLHEAIERSRLALENRVGETGEASAKTTVKENLTVRKGKKKPRKEGKK